VGALPRAILHCEVRGPIGYIHAASISRFFCFLKYAYAGTSGPTAAPLRTPA